MHCSFLAALVLCSSMLFAGSAMAVNYELVSVGDAGNARDTNQYGAVGYQYQIGKYEVKIGQYTEFLNAVAASDIYYSLFNGNMASDTNVAGISRTGSSGSYVYSVAGDSGNRPITYVSWWDAARFCNWMHNGQGSGSTETGAYTLNHATSGDAVAVNAGARFYIPTENEWYKAAYFSPALNAGAGGYYTYATQSMTDPNNVVGNFPYQANYYASDYSVTQSSTYASNQNYLTDVGAFTNSASFYGTFDQTGNVNEWNDLTGTSGALRGKRGGAWNNNAFDASSSGRGPLGAFGTGGEDSNVGFRLASPVAVPEPSTYAMALAGLACGGCSMWRRRMRYNRASTAATSLALAAVFFCATNAHAQVTLDMVTVGDPGNAADTTGRPNPAGAVAESFQIMKYEFTNQQYTAFLNSVAATNFYLLYDTIMSSDPRGGITRSGTSGSYTYAVKANMGDKPVNYVSWFNAARVSNWLMNGATGTSSTETGAYTLSGEDLAGDPYAPAVNPGATFYIPTEDQWYKAAYYKGGSTNAGYWRYATQSNTNPEPVSADTNGIGSAGSTGNFANWGDVADWNGQDGNVTTVGTNGGPSAYGAFDMSGNLSEWNDLTGAAGSLRGQRGGNWLYSSLDLSSSSIYRYVSDGRTVDATFRLASPVAVPEPSTYATALAGLAGGGWQMFRRRRAKASLTQPDAAAQ